jgi:hypothetical protein
MELFGLTLPDTPAVHDREVAATLALRMQAAAQALRSGGRAAAAASVRRDAREYLDARRRGVLAFPGAAARPCDEAARALLQITLDAPAMAPRAALLVA